MNEAKKQLKERVNFIVKKPKISLIAIIAMVLICALVAGCVAAGPTVKNEPDETEPETTVPAEPEEKVTVYMITEQKIYVNGELDSTATFRYDDHGRPTEVGFVKADGSGKKAELSYDEAGNLIGERNTHLYENVEEGVQQLDWNLTYDEGLLTRAERTFEDQIYVLNFSYNDDGQLILVEYPHPEEGVGGYFWQSYDYDADGKLIRETCCHRQNGEYRYSRYCYFYDEQGRMAEQYYCSAGSDTRLDPETLVQLDFKISPYEHFFFYYDDEGRLAHVGDGEEDAYLGGSAQIYSDEKYTFDANGNLVRKEDGKKLGHDAPSWTEYTYQAMELSKSDAIMHKRLIHGISKFILSYTLNNTQDPLFWEMCPKMLYSNNLQNMTFYYLLPYSQFELFLYAPTAPLPTEPQPTDPKPTEPKPTEPKPTDPEPTEPVVDPLAEINALLGNYDSWYNKALTSEYTTPAHIDLMLFFLGEFREESNRVTDSERARLKELYGYSDPIDMLDITCLPVDKMNQVLQDTFGITLDEIDVAGFEELNYLESTNCYYIVGGGASGAMDFNALDVETMEDGTIRVTYTQFTGSEDEMFVVTLLPHGDGYRILSNIRAE